MKTINKLLITLTLTVGLSLPACELLEDLFGDEDDEVIDDNHDRTVTDIDSNVYQTSIISGQEWITENLRVTRYNNGDAILTGLSDNAWVNTTEGAYAIYPHGSIDGLNSDAEVVSAYGILYNWYAVSDPRGLCPDGWHVPTDTEWEELITYVVAQGYSNVGWDNPNGTGNALKSCRQVGSSLGGDCDTSEHPRWNSNNTHCGFDEYGFSALPGGSCDAAGANFNHVGVSGRWWSSTERFSGDAWWRDINHNTGGVYRSDSGFSKRGGFSVRCVRVID